MAAKKGRAIGEGAAMAAPAMAKSTAGMGAAGTAAAAPPAAPPGAETPYYVRRIDVGKRYKALSGGGGGDGDCRSAISGLAGKDGRVHLGMEIDSLIRDVAPDLYEYFGAFVREDMNNALRQVRQARAKGRDAAHVHVILNRDARTVEVHDVDTDGMTVAVFRDVYTVLGRSGNLDGRESGQKGIGRFAFLAASDTKIVETYARETGERYGFIVRGGKVFEPIPDDMLSISEHGTRTSVCVDERHDFDALPEYVRQIAAASKAPVYLTTTGFSHNWDRARVSGKGGLGCKCRDAIRIQTDDFEFVGCMTCRELPNRRCDATYLIGIPIQTHGSPPCEGLFTTTTLNILDERKYEPTTSRDWLSKSASIRIWDAVTDAVAAELGRIECDPSRILSDIPPLVRMLAGKEILLRRPRGGGRGGDGGGDDDGDSAAPVLLDDIVSDSVGTAVQRLSARYDVLARVDRQSFDSGAIPRAFLPNGNGRDGPNRQYYQDGTYDLANQIVTRPLRWIIDHNASGDGQVWYAPDTALKWRRAAFEYVEDNRGPVIFPENGEGWEELERFGAKRIAPYVDATPRDKTPGRVSVRYGTQSVRKDARELGANVVCVPRNPGVTKLEKVCVEMRRGGFRTQNLGICPWHADAADSDAETFDRMRAGVDARTYRTTAGPMTGREILDIPGDRLAVCPAGNEWVEAVCDDGMVAGAAGGGGVVAVYGTDDADGDRLWLAYGYENGGVMPRILKDKDLRVAALKALGVPKKFAENDNLIVPDKARMIVGHLRMLPRATQKVMYLRFMAEKKSWSVYTEEIREYEQAAIYLSESDPSGDDLGLCRDIMRDMNQRGHDDMGAAHYCECPWLHMLACIAVNRLSRHYMGRSLHSRGENLYDRRRLESAKGAGMVIEDVLRHLFGEEGTAVKAALGEDDRVVIDAVVGCGKGGKDGVRMGGSLIRMLFGHRPSYSVECTGDGRMRIRGEIGCVPDYTGDRNGCRRGDPDFALSSDYDSW